jgi:hypothetical protein
MAESGMPGEFWIILTVVVVSLVVAGLIWRPLHNSWRKARFAEARRDFHRQRERLEAKFLQLGIAGGKSGAPNWLDCDFDDDVAYARNRSSGELSALVAVTIAMGSLQPDDELGPSTSDDLRSATAVFRFHRGHWMTDGRAIFNLSPTEAIHFYHRELEMVGQEVGQRS